MCQKNEEKRVISSHFELTLGGKQCGIGYYFKILLFIYRAINVCHIF